MTLEETAVELVNKLSQLMVQDDYIGAEHIARKRLGEVVAAEREACAKIAIDHADFCRREFYSGGHDSLDERATGSAWIAELIRKRA